MKKTWWVNFVGCADVIAETQQEAVDTFYSLFKEHGLDIDEWIKLIKAEED